MKSIHIISHCYSPSILPTYHKMLHLQILSLFQYTESHPDLHITISVCCAFPHDDPRTNKVLTPLVEKSRQTPNLKILRVMLPKSHLFRRAIGRNLVSKETKADTVWFTDADHLFLKDSLNEAHDQCLANPDADLIWPKTVNIHSRHAFGDALIKKALKMEELDVNLDEFVERRERKAIGGIQIVSGERCREKGYLDGTRWVNPVAAVLEHWACRCDVAFRKTLSKMQSVQIGGVYRIRHSRCSRDGGTKDHSR